MRTNSVTGPLRKAALAATLIAAPALTSVGCTDLTEQPKSSIAPNAFYQTNAEVISALAGLYSGLRDAEGEYYNISQVTTDETIVPTRGSDWYDQGKWIDLYEQTFGANTPGTIQNINAAWNSLFTDVARTNSILSGLSKATTTNKTVTTAETRFLRAWYYYQLMDLFGGVPIVTTTDIAARPRNSRAEVFKFIESELTAIRPDLPAKWDASNYGRITQGAVDALLANMYLNAQVFTGTPTAAGLTPGQARWQDAITVADRILNSGQYSLATNWQSNFSPTNQNSPENIFVVRHTEVTGLGLHFINAATHYNSFQNPGGWNGFSTIADTYNSFDSTDTRRSIFLVGPQNALDTGQPINDRSGNRLVFTPTIKDITSATEGEGVRVVKFTFDPNHSLQEMGNDFTIFRLAEIYMIKAEALNELGQTAQAVGLVNQLRARVYTPPQPLNPGAFTQASFRQQLLTERLHEFMGEAKRRQDMIRLGVSGITPNPYTAPRLFKTQTPAFKVVAPIPLAQIQTNPQLQQNPGY